MLATITSAVLVGVQGKPISVEVHISTGLPSFAIVGLPDAACRESRDRVRAAILSSGLIWPQKRVTVNLAPSGVRKGGAGLDLPIAVAVLVADGQLPSDAVAGRAFIGELGLDGSLRRVGGVLPLVHAVRRAEVVLPMGCAGDAVAFERTAIRAAPDLSSLIAALLGRAAWPAIQASSEVGVPDAGVGRPDFAEVRGQPLARLAAEVAAAGAHHLLMVGPPGAGKTLIAERIPGLLPPLSDEEAMEVTRIHSAAGLSLRPAMARRPPFRAPHHSASPVSLIGGGGTQMRPGELSCAHRGVLFLDELGEFPAGVLNSLRQPLEDGEVLVCRARASVLFPARTLLVAAMNPCPCGSDGGPGSCRCSDPARARYLARISGPLVDRFDLRVPVHRPDVAELMGPVATGGPPREWVSPEPTSVIAERVATARGRARSRGVAANGEIPAARLDELAPLDRLAAKLLESKMRQGSLSARGLHRVRRVARTVADLAGRDGPVGEEDIYASLGLRLSMFSGDGSDVVWGRPA